MTIPFTCPHCSTDFPVSEEDRGFSVYCKSCGRECVVPEDLGVTAKPADAIGDGVGTAARPNWMRMKGNDLEEPTTGSSTAKSEARSPAASGASEEKPRVVADAKSDAGTDPKPVSAARDSRELVSKIKLRDDSVMSSIVEKKPAAATPSKRANIFSSEGATRVLEKPAGEAECLQCRTKFPYTIEQQGTTVYCPSCGDGVPVGEQLTRVAVARAETPKNADNGTAPKLDAPKPRFYWFRSRAGLRTMAAVVVVLGVGVFATWKDPTLLPEGIRNVIPTGKAVAAPSKKEPAKKKTKHSPNQKITLHGIRNLLKWPDAGKALIQAQKWERDLAANELPQSEPRRTELKKVKDVLFVRLIPKSKSSSKYVRQFLKLIRDLEILLEKENVVEARKLYDKADALFRRYPKELAEESGSLVRYGGWLKRLELRVNGVRTVIAWLNKAAELARQGKPTEALEYQSRARWLSAYVDPGREFKRLDDLYRKTVTPLVSWALGKRAVNDAQDCHTRRDRKARDQQLSIANSKLPDIQPSLPGVRKTNATDLYVKARRLSMRRISRPVTTVFGRELDVRFRYEKALAQLADGNVGRFAAAAAEIKRRFDLVDGRDRLQTELERIIKQLPQLAFEMLSYAIDNLDNVADDERPKKLAEFRRAMKDLSVWKTLPRWGALDASLKSLE